MGASGKAVPLWHRIVDLVQREHGNNDLGHRLCPSPWLMAEVLIPMSTLALQLRRGATLAPLLAYTYPTTFPFWLTDLVAVALSLPLVGGGRVS